MQRISCDNPLKRWTILWIFPFLLISSQVGPAAAQSSSNAAGGAPQSAQRTVAAKHDGPLSVDVEVTDKLGHPVHGLAAGDFTLLDNGNPLKILGFQPIQDNSSQTSAVHVVIALDNINTGFRGIAWQKEELAEYLKEDGGVLKYPTTLAFLTEDGLRLEGGSSTDGKLLLASLNKFAADLRPIDRDGGYFAAGDLLEMSLTQLGQLAGYEAAQPGRKLILYITPGWPMFPISGDQLDLKVREWVFKSIVGMTNGLLEGHITLDTLDPFEIGRGNPFYYQTYLKPVVLAKDASYPNLSVQIFAQHSGGLVLVTGKDLTSEINTAVRDASAAYEVTFARSEGSRPNEFHSLQVKVDKPDLQARTAVGYYANPELLEGKTH